MSDLKKYFSDLKTVENKLMMTKNLDIFMHYIIKKLQKI